MKVVDSLRSNPGFFTQAIHDPALVGLGMNKAYYEYRHGAAYNTSGVDIVEEEDWDNLILLDACRYDIYAEITPFDAPVEMRESRGSSSQQFVRGNFDDKKLHDTVVISGNQWYLNLQSELQCEFHDYHDVDRDIGDGFVPSAEAVTEAVLANKDRYSDKKLLIHYMQPHHPFLTTDVDGFKLTKSGLRNTVRESSVDIEGVRTAYRDNLKYVLDHVQRAVTELDGKTVVSSDHGEMLGGRLSPFPVRWFGHPPGVYTDELVCVPWQVVSDGPRRSITSDPPQHNFNVVNESAVEQNLKDLGYL